MDVFNAFKGVADMVREAIEGVMPRQAVVTRSEGTGVWVRYTPVDPSVPEMWFPSSIAGVPAGTSGWVHPLAGGKGRFIADNVAVPMPFASQSGHVAVTTTSISAYERGAIGSPITIPNGQYRVDAMYTIPFLRSVNTGLVYVRAVMNGTVVQAEKAFNRDFLPWGANEIVTVPYMVSGGVVTVTDGQLQVEIDARGSNTAGTTTLMQVGIQGILTRIGDVP